MTIAKAIQKIGEIGIVPVIRAANVDEAERAVEALYSGGVPIFEITMTIPDAPAVIRRVVDDYASRALIGAGTVLTSEQAKRCLDAGAQFLVSPGLIPTVLDLALAGGVLGIPGALTPTELASALAHGSTLVKIFPCGSLGGPTYLKALRGPFPTAGLIPTGGVSLANAAEYVAAGAFALGVGSELVDQAALRAGKVEKVRTAAQTLVEAVRRARESCASQISRGPRASTARPAKGSRAIRTAE